MRNLMMGICLWAAGQGSALAVAIEMVTGKPLAAAATSVAKAEGAQLLFQGGQVLAAAASSEAWTWDYGFAIKAWPLPPKSKAQEADTTLDIGVPKLGIVVDGNQDPNKAHAIANQQGSAGRFAIADGQAQIREYLNPARDANGNVREGNLLEKGEILVDARSNRFAVAKSVAGIGKNYVTDGANIAATIATKLLQVALDPPALLGFVPGELDLHSKLPDEGGPAGFYFDVGYIDPFGTDHKLFSMVGELAYDQTTASYFTQLSVAYITGTTGVPDASQFVPVLQPDGHVVAKYTAGPSDSDRIEIPFTIPAAWGVGAAFTIYNELGVVSRSVDIPEPSAILLLTVLLLFWRWPKRRPGNRAAT